MLGAGLWRRARHAARQLDAQFWNTLREHSLANDAGALVYDIGFHIGQDTDLYLSKGFRVVAVEADPVLAEMGRIKFHRAVSEGRLVIVNCGVVASDDFEPQVFFVNEKISEWSSFDKQLACRESSPFHEVLIQGRTLATIMREFGEAYFVKIDIEGYDHIALDSLLSADFRPRYISVENGNKNMLSALENAGYGRFKYVQQRDVPRQIPVFPPKHGKYIKRVFSLGSSGYFGEEAPGEWVSVDVIKEQIARVWDLKGGWQGTRAC